MNQEKSQKSNLSGLPPKRGSDGKFDPNLTPEQVALMSPEDKADYMAQLGVDALNKNVTAENKK